MLRSLGIPARVAVGYTGGRYDAGRKAYLVLDRDAHSWVEVWFPGEGWLPFDPTPGRSVPNPASVSSPDYAPSRIDVDLGGLVGRPSRPGTPRRPRPQPETPAPEQPRRRRPGRRARLGGGGGGSVWQWVLARPRRAAGRRPAPAAGRRRRGRLATATSATR